MTHAYFARNANERFRRIPFARIAAALLATTTFAAIGWFVTGVEVHEVAPLPWF